MLNLPLTSGENIIFFFFNTMSATKWHRRYLVGLSYHSCLMHPSWQSIMCFWCAFNAVCSSGHLPKYALGESVCVNVNVWARSAPKWELIFVWSPHASRRVWLHFWLLKWASVLWRDEGEGPGWVCHLWKEFTWKNCSCDVWFKTRVACKQGSLMCLLWSINSTCS